MYEKMAVLVKEGDSGQLVSEVKAAVEEGYDPLEIINRGLLPAMEEIGARFKKNEVYIPEVLVAAHAMLAALRELKPLLSPENSKPLGKVLIGTVQSDLHDIGKNIVAMMFEAGGFEVKDLGVDVAPEVFLEEARQFNPDIIGLSALLTTTLPYLEKTIQAFSRAGLRDQFLFMIGGAPVTGDYAEKIGADGFASDAASAVEKAREILQV